MTSKVFALDTKPGVQRDGTTFDKEFYTDGRWVRFQRGRPRKIGGYRLITDKLYGPSRGIWLNSKNNVTDVFSGWSGGVQSLSVNPNGDGSGLIDFTVNSFTASNLNLWQFDGFYDREGGVASIVAHPGQNLAAIDSTVNTPVLIGDINGSTLNKIGVFTIAATLASTTTVTVATTALIGIGQTVTGAGIPFNTTVVDVPNTTTFTISNAATLTGPSTLTIDNGISVSGGVVVLHPYIFVYGNDGFIGNCAAGNADDWVSADANQTNVATGKIVQGLPVRGGSNAPSGLFWSLDSLVRVSYIGGVGTPPAFWRYDIITSQTSIMSSQCAIEYDGIYYWIAADRFMLYNGVAKELANDMNQNYFFDNLNYSQRQKVWASKVPRYGEIWWFYPKGDAIECTDAIIYNVRANTWYDAGQALGARRSAGYFSQVFQYPIAAGWEQSIEEFVTSGTFELITGYNWIGSSTYDGLVETVMSAQSLNIPSGTTVTGIQQAGVRTQSITNAGTGYIPGTYTNVAVTYDGPSIVYNVGDGARATVVVGGGGTITSVTITTPGGVYSVGNVLTVASSLIGGTGSGFTFTVTAVWPMTVTLSAAATGTATETVEFYTIPGLIKLWQHEYGTNEVIKQNVNAIESYFETSDLGWVSGGPSQPSMVGENVWIRVERVEPDFIQSGEMEVYVTGSSFADSEDITSAPYVFLPDQGKVDMREQRRELRLKFRSNVQDGNYQMGKVLINAEFGDVRPT
jgi:hypothetical protein